jgi:hypothetical protein
MSTSFRESALGAPTDQGLKLFEICTLYGILVNRKRKYGINHRGKIHMLTIGYILAGDYRFSFVT